MSASIPVGLTWLKAGKLQQIHMFQASIRFWYELNDFLRREQRERAIRYKYNEPVSVKHAFESLGVPHVEVGLILVGGNVVGFFCLHWRGGKDRSLLSGERDYG